jgi:hypothetical protein
MNVLLNEIARQFIRDGLAVLPDGHKRTFRLMYGRKNGKRSVQDAENMPIDDVIAEIPTEKLDWAMQQVDASLAKSSLTKTKIPHRRNIYHGQNKEEEAVIVAFSMEEAFGLLGSRPSMTGVWELEEIGTANPGQPSDVISRVFVTDAQQLKGVGIPVDEPSI